MSEEKPYDYFDTADGQDIFPKLWYVLKPASVTAIGISTLDVMLYSHPKGYLKTLARYGYISLPILGVCTAFVVTTNLATNIRNKDDICNWAIGGLAAGGVFGAWRKSHPAGWGAGAAFAILGMGKKHAVQNGYVLTPPEINQAQGGLRAASKYDYTLTRNTPTWKQ